MGILNLADREGNAYFTNYQVNGTQNLLALTSTGKRTEVLTLTPTP